MPRKATPVEVRVWRRIQKRGPDDCWLWIGCSKDSSRHDKLLYGRIGAVVDGKQKTLYVHRVVYVAEIGPIPPGYEVDHRCNNTLCCNPCHLRAVTPLVNESRSSSPPSLNRHKDHCPQNHAYDEANTGYRTKSDGRWRYCRTCARLAQRAKRDHGMTYPEWLTSINAE